MSKSFDSQSLINELQNLDETTLVFSVDGTDIKPGYHVTEIKQAAVSSLDCQRGQESWREVIIQLLDGRGMPTQQHMSVTKFLSIVKPSVKDQGPHQLFFEFSPGNRAFNKMTVAGMETTGNRTTVYLNAQKPQCKPMTQKLSSIGLKCCG